MIIICNKSICRILPVLFALLLLTGCPLPYQYTPEGYPGQAAGADPSTPDISASPVALYSESSGKSGTVADGGSAITSSDTEITFASATVGAVIYYTTDGSTPDPRSASTRKFVPGSPLALSVADPTIDASSASVTIRATAIGPNMKPSLVSTTTIGVQYPQAAAPAFSLPSAVYPEDRNVAISSATEGARIYYTIVPGNGPAPRPVPGQEGTREYSGLIALVGPRNVWTIGAIAEKDQLIPSVLSEASYSITYTGCAEPFFTPSAGTYDNDIDLALRGQAGSTIWYTADGNDPTIGSSTSCEPNAYLVLPGAFALTDGSITMKAQATASGYNESGVTAATYTFKAAAPKASFGGGTYDNAFGVSLASETTGAEIRYTLDGSDPRSEGAIPYTEPFRVERTATILRAMAFKSGYLPSDESMETYTLRCATPAFDRAGGDYFFSYKDVTFPITVTCATRDATINYTVDDTTWTAAPPDPTGGLLMVYLPIPSTVTLRAYARRDGFDDSATNSVEYRMWELPQLQPIEKSLVLTPPSILPAGAPAGDYWMNYYQWGWTDGTYTYVVWDQDFENSVSIAIAAYDANWGKRAEWLYAGNRYINSISIQSAGGTIQLTGQTTTTIVDWLDLMPPF